ncbi:MAG: hypothetical protein ACYTBJ_22125 [Planctomycetota bacterium]|jgi:hypothetical protein
MSNKLREEFEKEQLKKQQKRGAYLDFLFDWNKAIIEKWENLSQGCWDKTKYGNIKYVEFLEKKLGIDND